MSKIYDIIQNEQNIKILAHELAIHFIEEGNTNNIEYNFDLSSGKVKNRTQNTFFCFDTKTGTLAHRLKKAQFDEDLKNITKKDEEKLQKDIFNFTQKVGKEITENYSIELKNKIRTVVLSQADEKIYPLSLIEVRDIDIVNFESVPEPAKYLLIIGKNKGINLPTGEITVFVHERQEETGQSVEEIFEEEKNTNPLFHKIESLTKGSKYLFDVTLAFFVDYSLNKEEAPQIA